MLPMTTWNAFFLIIKAQIGWLWLPLLWQANQTASIHAQQLVTCSQTAILKSTNSTEWVISVVIVLLKCSVRCGNQPHQQLLLWRQTWCRCPVSPDQHPVGTNTELKPLTCGTQNSDLNSTVQLVKHRTSRNNMSQNKRWLKAPWTSTVGSKTERNTAGTKVNIYQGRIYPK